MDRVSLQAMRDALRVHLSTLDSISICCTSCRNFSPAQRCRLADAVPPEDVQKAGCDEWSFDGVPF